MNAGALRRASGHIEVWELDDIPANWPPDREVQIMGPVHDRRGAEVMLASAQDNMNVRVAVGPKDRSSDTLEIWVGWQIGDQLGGRMVATLPRGDIPRTRIPFSVIVEGQRVIVEAAGVRVEAPIALGPDIEFRAGCQGGEFMFYELDWSR